MADASIGATLGRANHLANVVVSQLNTTIVMAGSFVVTPAILHGLGDGAYGGWLLLNSFMQYMRFLDLGTSAGTMKYGAAAHEQGDGTGLKKVLDTSAAIFVAIAMTTAIATVLLTVLLPHIYPTIANGQATAILALGAAVAIDLGFRPFAATLRMRSLFFVHDGIEIVSYTVFKLGLVLYFAYHGGLSYRLLAFLTLGETLLRVVLVVGTSVVLFPSSRHVNPLGMERAMARKLAGMGAAVTIISLAEIVRFQLDAAVLGFFLPESPVSISIFAVGTRLPSVAYSSIGVIGSVLMPKFSGLTATGDNKQVFALLRRASLSTALVASLVLVNIAVLGPQFLELWLHKPWIATSSKILLFMLPAYFVGVMSGPATSLLIGRAQLRGLATLTVVEAFVNFLLSIALVRPLGIWGVAIGTAVPLVFFRGVVFPFLLRRELGLAPLEYFGMHARGIGIGALYLLLVGGLSFVAIPSFTRFFILGLLSSLVFGVLVLSIMPEARAGLQKRLGRFRRTPAV